ncbi:SRPBCC domain-containing protein [Cohnella sp. REN36]|uniref:SRPBCC domain-containing protein n=1 Tax=Cohnella sp. REN36 TaxID=2887347 RepID=UPI001D13A801|nr:SRPBCC domain-containing protein [Cohnella sp. REN36]MCC3374532.1 SRPBCC domain-containing protein [Cohnella sp. REN36]
MKGQTAAAGFQVGVRRTYPISQTEAWDLLFSPEGLRLWLGELPALELEKGYRYETLEGTTGELRVVNPPEHIRLTWQPKGWGQPSTLQIRFLPSTSGPDRTTISFHQEKLSDAHAREAMKSRWEETSAIIADRVAKRA